jgi:peptidoglycan/LPS O-acetylase OafA/YrhL
VQIGGNGFGILVVSRSIAVRPAVSIPTGDSYAPQLPSRVPSLDGLRAVSIILVIIGHSSDSLNAPQFLNYFNHLGNLGVRCFFVISGFLITTLLLKEQNKTGAISMRGFYIRRSLRIFPPSLAYIGIVAGCSALGWLTLKPGDLAHALTYTMNYRYNPAHWFRHLWSLSVEEQFYLLWPGLLWLAGPRRGVKVAWSVVLMVPIIRAIMWYYFHASDSAMTKQFESTADALATGCLLSMYFNKMGSHRLYQQFLSSKLFLVVALGLVLGGNGLFVLSPASFYIVGQTIANVGTVLCIDWCIRNFGTGIGWVLNWQPMVYVGVLSYSLYLWQNAFLNPDWPAWPARLPINLFFIGAFALASYYFVEQPFLRLKSLVAGKEKIAR